MSPVGKKNTSLLNALHNSLIHDIMNCFYYLSTSIVSGFITMLFRLQCLVRKLGIFIFFLQMCLWCRTRESKNVIKHLWLSESWSLCVGDWMHLTDQVSAARNGHDKPGSPSPQVVQAHPQFGLMWEITQTCKMAINILTVMEKEELMCQLILI